MRDIWESALTQSDSKHYVKALSHTFLISILKMKVNSGTLLSEAQGFSHGTADTSDSHIAMFQEQTNNWLHPMPLSPLHLLAGLSSTGRS